MSLAQPSQANWGGVQPNPCNGTKLNHMPAHSSIIVCYVLADGPHVYGFIMQKNKKKKKREA
jgi:hypothetical protein